MLQGKKDRLFINIIGCIADQILGFKLFGMVQDSGQEEK